MSDIIIAGTADTKGDELAYLHGILSQRHDNLLRVDLGTRSPATVMDVSAKTVAGFHPEGPESVFGSDDRGTAVGAMGIAFENYCRANAGSIAGIIGIGGGGGTAIVTAGMRQLPYGVPKVMVSTLASGDVAPYVDVSDINMFPSVTDIAGLNRLSRVILHNAAQALSGMVGTPAPAQAGERPAVGLTMFGVTTQCVTAIVSALEKSHECMVFHATGTGGRAMERLVAGGMIDGLVDITTTEVCDLLLGGVLPADPTRLDVVAERKIPYVGSVGALDMVNFWAPETVPDAFRNRRLYHHNANVTLMRTTADECARIGRWIGKKLNACAGPVRLLLPTKGVSALDIEGGDFWDPEADAVLFETLESTIDQTADRRIISLPYHINDPEFAAAAANAYLELTER